MTNNRKEYLKQYRTTPKGKWCLYKYNSKIKGLSFELTFKEFTELVSQNCYYCGEKGFGIDRIDNNIGYKLSNCYPCCSICNYMKSDRNIKQFTNHCKKIASNLI